MISPVVEFTLTLDEEVDLFDVLSHLKALLVTLFEVHVNSVKMALPAPLEGLYDTRPP